METIFLTLVIFISLISLLSCQVSIECEKQRCPSNGQCVDNISMCPIAIICPEGYTKINQFTCSKEEALVDDSKCDAQSATCWDGSCVKDPNTCPSMPTCPSSKNVRCPDNSCVESIDDCPAYVSCPSFIPIRCPNGDCRMSLKDCPGLIKCPKEFSVLCNDGSCRMTNDECELPATQTQCRDQTMTRCPDGTCTSSKFLCSTPKTCPLGTVLCWNGSCAKNSEQCTKPSLSQSNSCSNAGLITCMLDGSCKTDISLCPTAPICSVEKPVKCWDFSCKESIEKCPPYQECPSGTRSCADGTCTAPNQSCGTHITCSMDAPFKCFDNTCRIDPQDCPPAPECPGKFPILCWDGKCVANRVDCNPADTCPVGQPIKCPDNMCRNTIDECKTTNDCPAGFIRCQDGSCRREAGDCVLNTCPLNQPVGCPNGQCKSKLENCSSFNGCPFYSSIKCKNGKCVSKEKDCDGETVSCLADYNVCPDGSCVPSTQICPTITGCPPDSPYKCADGSCIDINKTKCAIPICPSNLPIKCLSGLCVVTASSCPSNNQIVNSSECPSGLVPCADGSCESNIEECKPVFGCSNGFEMCEDGSCRSSLSLCPQAKTCPVSRSFRCSDGSCAAKIGDCLNLSGCPLSSPIKCTNTGLCVNKQERCSEYENNFALANGCDKHAPLKCLNGKCVNDLNQCEAKSDCSEEQVYCPNTGTCADDIRDCITLGEDCPAGYVRCIKDGKCKKKYQDCLNHVACPVSFPFRCPSGECQKYPILISKNSNETSTAESCKLSIECPNYKPYLCADGSCAEKSSFCLSLQECPSDTPIRCKDRTCAASIESCEKRNRCPFKNPILCLNSAKCVDNLYDCFSDFCPPSSPYRCVNGLCEKSPLRCVVNDLTNSTICGSDSVTCYDGTCRLSIDQCPIYPGCTNFNFPYKCPDGSCAVSASSCPPAPKCAEGMNLCEDGICRKTCPIFGGCPNTAPLLCPTGICVNTISECAGQSDCPLDTPFRCMDGSCVEFVNQCKRNKRDTVDTDIVIYATLGRKLKTELVIDEANDLIGSIKIPSGTFYSLQNSTRLLQSNFSNTNITPSTNPSQLVPSDATIIVKSVPASVIRGSKVKYDETRSEDLMKIFPYADAMNENTLEYQYSVLSSVIKIQFMEKDLTVKNIMILSLAYDFPHNNEYLIDLDYSSNYTTNEMPLDPHKDVCLAKLNSATNLWECTTTPFTTVKEVNFYLSGGILEEGIYAVVIKTRPDSTLTPSVENFLAKYIMIILISAIVTGIVVALGIYTFIRIYRYRHKYKQMKEEEKQMNKQMQELTSMETRHLGQTVGDNIDNIIYTSNPAFRIVKSEKKNQRLEELQNLQEQLMKRYKAFEKNNDQLKNAYESINKQYEELQKYKDHLAKKEEALLRQDIDDA
jgi:hypothetical protein